MLKIQCHLIFLKLREWSIIRLSYHKRCRFPLAFISSASNRMSFWEVALAKHCWAARASSVTCMMQFSRKIWCETVRLKRCRGSPCHTEASAVSLSEETPEQISIWLLCNISAAHSTSCVSHSLLWTWGLRTAAGLGLSLPLHRKRQNRQHQASASMSYPLQSRLTVSKLDGDSVSVVTEHLQDRIRQPQPQVFWGIWNWDQSFPVCCNWPTLLRWVQTWPMPPFLK